MRRVLVLNSDMSPLGTANWQTAVSMVIKEKAEVVVDTTTRIHPKMFLPAVIRLIKAVRNLWRKKVPWSKMNVHTRDRNICQYCGTKLAQRDCTIDHVVPKDQGGKNSWTNTVCSCFECNNKKDARTPSQARMTLRKRPWQPTIMEFILAKLELEGVDKLLRDLWDTKK